MKIKKELIAIMDKRGYFVKEFSSNDPALSFSTGWVEDINVALNVPVEYYEKEKERYENLAKLLEGQLVKIEAEYEVKTLDGEEPEIVEDTKDEFDQMVSKAFKRFIDSKLGGLD